jgi:hypothetical protein
MDKGHFADCIKSQQAALKEIILRYVQEVTPTMKSAKEDAIRLQAIARKPIASYEFWIGGCVMPALPCQVQTHKAAMPRPCPQRQTGV